MDVTTIMLNSVLITASSLLINLIIAGIPQQGTAMLLVIDES